MPTMTIDLMAERASQLAYWAGKANTLVTEMRDLDNEFRDGAEPFTYIPPDGDDWTAWRGIALWCAIHQRYNWAVSRQVALESGKGPFYCKDHEPKIEGGRAALCLKCSWENYLRDEALAEARRMRNDLARQQRVAS